MHYFDKGLADKRRESLCFSVARIPANQLLGTVFFTAKSFVCFPFLFELVLNIVFFLSSKNTLIRGKQEPLNKSSIQSHTCNSRRNSGQS